MVRHLPGTLFSSARHYVEKLRERPTGPVDEDHLDHLLSSYDDDVAFVHVGLSDVNAAFEGNPYEFVLSKLGAHFSAILTPGFTPSFRETGRYHKTASTPEVGTFSRLFFDDADCRTDDAIHSILVRGDFSFDGCDHHDTFGATGCYARLDEENVRFVNIGTPWLICTQLHYVEERFGVPYTERVAYDGRIEYGDGRAEPITQVNFDKNKYLYYWDRLGLQRDLAAAGVLDHFDLNGLTVMSLGARDLRDAVLPRLAEDPYYLVRSPLPRIDPGTAIAALRS